MEPHQSVRVTSSWNVQGPYDIHSILQVQRAEESRCSTNSVLTHSIKLAPPPFANEDDEATPPCEVFLACQSCIAIGSIEVISNARHIELYDNQDAYCCTVKGERWEDGDDQLTKLGLYSARLVVDSPVPHCRLKFVSLTDKFQLALVSLWVTSSRAEPGSFTGLGSRSIDMAKVRDMMSSLRQPIPENVESLMQTVEQYQKNQAAVLEDFQQVATERLSASMTRDPKASLASNMAGLLSAFSKASSMQPQARTRPTSNTSATSTHEVSSVNRPTPSRQFQGGSQTFDMDSLSKLMTSFGGTTLNTGRNPGDMGQDMFNAMRAMCRDVSHMRAADRQAAERSYGAERRNDWEGQEVDTENRETVKPADNQILSELEQRLMGYIAASEERIMGRFDRRIELLQDHIDLRFNRLEALLEEKSKASSDQNNELQSEDVD